MRMTPEEDRRNPTERDRQREDLRLIIGLAVWAIAVEIRQMEGRMMTQLDEAVTRITTDINNAFDAITALRAEIAAVGNAGADVTALNAAAQKLEDAVGNAANTVVTVTPPAEVPPAGPADQPTSDTNLTSGEGVAPQADVQPQG